MQTVVETPTYLSAAEKLFSEDARADIVLTVAADPECGEVMKGTGGFRKFRVARGEKVRAAGRVSSISSAIIRFPFFSLWSFRKTRKRTS